MPLQQTTPSTWASRKETAADAPSRAHSIQQIGPNTFVIIDEKLIDLDAAESESEEESEGD